MRAAYQKNRRRFFLIALRLFLFPTKCISLALCGSPIRYSLITSRYVNRPYVFMSAFYFNIFYLHQSVSPPEKPGLVIMYHHLNYTTSRQFFQLTILLHQHHIKYIFSSCNIKLHIFCSLILKIGKILSKLYKILEFVL